MDLLFFYLLIFPWHLSKKRRHLKTSSSQFYLRRQSRRGGPPLPPRPVSPLIGGSLSPKNVFLLYVQV
jgi:hypothetical protein